METWNLVHLQYECDYLVILLFIQIIVQLKFGISELNLSSVLVYWNHYCGPRSESYTYNVYSM